MNCCVIASPLGNLLLTEEGGALIGVSCCDQPQVSPETVLLTEAKRQIDGYFAGALRRFDLPFSWTGSPFRQAVYEACRQIPYGHTVTYGELARRIGAPKAGRAVGGALHVNPLLLIVPCHRVVGARGALTGFACGVERKRYLLTMEKQYDE